MFSILFYLGSDICLTWDSLLVDRADTEEEGSLVPDSGKDN